MPYSYPSNVPDAIKKLPAHAQEIFVSAYNSAYKQYDGDEAKANATAWAAVKKKYEKVNDKWRAKKMAERIFRFVDVIDKNELQFNEDGTATSEAQFFAIGKWQHQRYGKIEFDEDRAKQAIKNYANAEKELNLDYNHLGLDGAPDEAIASGWLIDGLTEIGQRGDNKGKKGLWGIVQWTKKAAEYIKNGEYKFISPEFTDEGRDKKTGKKIGFTLQAAALTNRPFLEGMAPVALSERALAEIENVSLDEILGDINAWLAKAAPQIKGKKGSPAIRLYLRGVKEKLRELIKKSKSLTDEEAEMLLTENPTKTENGEQFPARAYAYVPDPQKPTTWKLPLWENLEKKETPGSIGRAIAAFSPSGFRGKKVQIPAEDVAKVKAKIRAAWKRVNPDKEPEDMPTHIKSTEGGGEMDKKVLCAQLGLNETATNEEIELELKRLTELQGNKALTESLGLKEQATEAEVLEAVTKLKEAGSQKTAEGIVKLADFQRLETEYAGTKSLAEGLKKDNDALKLTLLEKDRDEVVGKALTELKILPKAKEVWEKRFMADPENIRTLIETLAPVLELKEHGSGGGGSTGSAGEQLAIKCKELQAADKELDYSAALKQAQLENPVLAKEYAAENRA